ncbi:hypothetical protein CEUSTIGMA_g13731.t1 [Chlamydomonas eustigma]|uniref:Uncharacterized protein n=1 Tax=Chlamydomonas eustigma TaxID=1157962 RepID=A0A250XTM3_9CHLO|nr:hypothetical protein CEUSTIGMA_g13731.t1 [Chlamydomonas eustigma]|eukprot:GAX86319.1 hypothetical protein CEUSTIGMA_g13731.t1 [Chlamydomonas eustigma]
MVHQNCGVSAPARCKSRKYRAKRFEYSQQNKHHSHRRSLLRRKYQERKSLEEQSAKVCPVLRLATKAQGERWWVIYLSLQDVERYTVIDAGLKGKVVSMEHVEGLLDISLKNTLVVSADASQLLLLWMPTFNVQSRLEDMHEQLLKSRASMTEVKRGATKSSSCGGKMFCAGLTNPRNQHHLPGRYLKERKDRAQMKIVDDVLAMLADEVYRILPVEVDRMFKDSPPCDVMRDEDGRPCSRGFTNYTLTANFSNKFHVDTNDSSCGGIMWFQQGEERQQSCMLRNGAFLVPSLGVFMRPGNGSFVFFDLSKQLHGTAPPATTEARAPELNGVAIFCRSRFTRDAIMVSKRSVQVASACVEARPNERQKYV